jgi:predicted membrane chloride channel (bestrophin family)
LEGFRDGILVGGDASERELIRRLTDLRAEYFSIGDLCAGRMPIAYVQLVQILVDTLVWLAPFSLYPELGSLSIPLCAVLTHFFKGLLELSKSFLDPFGNDGYPQQNIRVDVLVSELNFGAASRWVEAGDRVPNRSSPSPERR